MNAVVVVVVAVVVVAVVGVAVVGVVALVSPWPLERLFQKTTKTPRNSCSTAFLRLLEQCAIFE